MPNKESTDNVKTYLRRSKTVQENGKMAGRRDRRLATIPGVKEDAAQILEKFLQRKLANQGKKSTQVNQSYQAVATVKITEDNPQRHYFRSDSYRKASVDSILRDSGEVQDETDSESENLNFRGKTSSLPSSYRTRIDRDVFSNKKLDKSDIPHSPAKKAVPSDYHDRKARTLPKAGSISSSDTDGEESIKKGRKKKSIFTRTKERLRQAFKKQSNEVDKILKEKDSIDKKRKKIKIKKPKPKSSKSNKEKEDVVAEVRTHTHTHIHQEVLHPNGRSGHPLIIRTEDTVEDMEVEDKVQMRHTKKSISLKESDNGIGGVFGRIRKSFSLGRRRSAKESISASKSDEPVNSKFSVQAASRSKNFKRTNSEPASEALSCEKGEYSLNQRKTFSGGDKQKATEFFSELISRQIDKLSDNDFSDVDTVESPTGIKSADISVPSPSSPPSSTVQFGAGLGNSQRGNLHLSGLTPSIAKQESFDLDYDCNQVDQYVRSSDGKVRKRSHVCTGENLSLPSHVVIDGKDSPDYPGDDVPFEHRSDSEKDQMYDDIARRLADIADTYVESEAETPKDELTSLEQKLLDCLRNKGDQINDDINFPTSPALQMVKNATYNTFQNTVQKAIGHENSVKQIAMLFHLTKRAVQVAGAGGAIAIQIKENTLRYFEDKFAAWIVGQGGWDSMLEDSDSDFKPD